MNYPKHSTSGELQPLFWSVIHFGQMEEGNLYGQILNPSILTEGVSQQITLNSTPHNSSVYELIWNLTT